MKDPTARTEWTLSHCADCHRITHFWRREGQTFRCILCGLEKQIREVDRARDGLLE